MNGLVVFTLLVTFAVSTVYSQDCEVCVSFLNKFLEYAGDDVQDVKKSEAALVAMCKTATDREGSFCYYIGASETSATRIIGEVTKPLSYGKPVEKVCKELGKKDGQICDLKYDKPIDVSDLGSMRVKDLKKILSKWGEKCRGCAEKRDFIEKIEQVKHVHLREL